MIKGAKLTRGDSVDPFKNLSFPSFKGEVTDSPGVAFGSTRREIKRAGYQINI
jgi:hypothetical protein